MFVGALLVLIEGSNDYMREWLKATRLEKGLRVEEVAEQVDITGSYYTMIEAGSRNPSVKVAKRLGVLLGVEWSRFFEGEKVAVE